MTAKRADGTDNLARIHLTLPTAFLKDLDEAARNNLMSRSDYIRMALMEKMNRRNLVESPEQDEESELERLLKEGL